MKREKQLVVRLRIFVYELYHLLQVILLRLITLALVHIEVYI